MSRTVPRLIILLSVIIALCLLVFGDQFLQKWLNWLTLIVEIGSAVGLASLWKKQAGDNDLWLLWPLAVLSFVFTSTQAIATIPLHGIEVRVHLAPPGGLHGSQFDIIAERSKAALLPAERLGDSVLVFHSRGLVLNWNDTLEIVRIKCDALNWEDSSGIAWPSGSYVDIFGRQIVDFNLSGRRASVQVNTAPPTAVTRLNYRTTNSDTIVDTSFVGSIQMSFGVGGMMEVSAKAEGFSDYDTLFRLDSSIILQVGLEAGYASLTVETFNLGGNEERSAVIYIDDTLTAYEPFSVFSIKAFQRYKIRAHLQVDESRTMKSEVTTIDFHEPIDTTIRLTLHPVPWTDPLGLFFSL